VGECGVTVLDSHSGAPSSGPFAGFGEDAPLDLPSSPKITASILSRLRDGTADALSAALASVGNCVRPVRLAGSSTTIDRATGEVLASFSSADAPLRQLLLPCGNRRAHVCPACSRVYARDTFELIRAGVVGGKTVPADVASSPLLFVTLTAPSFGYVHGVRPDGGACRPRSSDRVQTCPHGWRMSCHRSHEEGDRLVGAPMCRDCYDWTGAIVWQWHAPELWRRTTIALRRHLAAALGLPARTLGTVCSVQYAKVAEYQARGMVHFHALIRLDGPDGPGSPAPMDGQALADVVRDAARSVVVTAPPTEDDDASRLLAWGHQLDIKTITGNPARARTSAELSPEQVAGYLAKYATKDAGLTTADGVTRPHIARLVDECERLARAAKDRDERRRAGLDIPTVPCDPKTSVDHYRLLSRWSHMVGFRGHFSSKSRRYSVTLGQLRRARQRFQRLTAQAAREGRPLDTRDLEARLLAADDDETTLVIGEWSFVDHGWPRPGDAALATAAAARAREYAQWRAGQRRSTHTPTR